MSVDDLPGQDPLSTWWAQQHDELALSLGRFAIEFAEMEDALNRTIHEILGLQENTGYALTSAIFNVSTRLDILESLVAQIRLLDGHQEIIQAAVDEAFKINSKRNWFLHDAWAGTMTLPGNGEAPRFRKRRMRPKGSGRAWQMEAFSAPDVDEARKQCERVSAALEPIVDTMKNERLLQLTDSNRRSHWGSK
jgi:hypothetical protein